MKRKQLSRQASQKSFKKNTGVHTKNSAPRTMRGGIRL
nr:MAG: hypothetical protein [Microvirus sp.]